MDKNKAIFKFNGRSSGGIREYSILCRRDGVCKFWAEFTQNCVDLDNCSSSIVRQFLGLACREEPMDMLERRGDDFLLTTESIWEWFGYWKRLELPFPGYVQRHIVYIAVYVVRYCISLHKERCSLDSRLVKVINGKELATFILNDWVGDGLVGVTATTDGNRTLIKEFRFRNKDLARIYCDYFESGIATVRASEFNHFADSFEDSLGNLADGIHGYGDFSESSLLCQVSFYKKKYLTEPYRAQKALRHVVGVYRYITNTEQGCRILDEGNFSAGLLRSMSILRFLSEGWEYVHYQAMEPTESRLKLVIVLKDMTRLGTRFVNGDALAFDLSMIESDFYRNLVWRHIRSDRTVLFRGSNIHYLVECLHYLEEAKRKTGKKQNTFTSTESRMLRAFVLEKPVQDNTAVQIFGGLRKFFEWANEQHHIVVETEIAINCLKYRAVGCSTSTRGNAIPRQDLDRLLGRMAMEGELSYRAKLLYVIVNMLAVTRFRPSQVCIMDIQAIRLEDRGQYCFIHGLTKISHGDKTWSLAPASVYADLESLVNSSAAMRERCYDPNIRDKVFLYETANGFDFIRETDVKLAMEQACINLELPHWTPYSLRKMHATVWDELDRMLGYHGELAAQAMGHKKYDTTRRHYIDRSFEEFKRVGGAMMLGSDEMMEREYQELLQNGRI